MEAKWWKAIKNSLCGWQCPKGRHAGSDVDAPYRDYAIRAAERRALRMKRSGGDEAPAKTIIDRVERNQDDLTKAF